MISITFVQHFRVGKDKLGEDEQLDYDSDAYIMYHALNVDWPCLSFDIVNDNLGTERSRVQVVASHWRSLVPYDIVCCGWYSGRYG